MSERAAEDGSRSTRAVVAVVLGAAGVVTAVVGPYVLVVVDEFGETGVPALLYFVVTVALGVAALVNGRRVVGSPRLARWARVLGIVAIAGAVVMPILFGCGLLYLTFREEEEYVGSLAAAAHRSWST
jgi:hypothetical protein